MIEYQNFAHNWFNRNFSEWQEITEVRGQE